MIILVFSMYKLLRSPKICIVLIGYDTFSHSCLMYIRIAWVLRYSACLAFFLGTSKMFLCTFSYRSPFVSQILYFFFIDFMFTFMSVLTIGSNFMFFCLCFNFITFFILYLFTLVIFITAVENIFLNFERVNIYVFTMLSEFFRRSPLNFIKVNQNFYVFKWCVSLNQYFSDNLTCFNLFVSHQCGKSRSSAFSFQLRRVQILCVQRDWWYLISSTVQHHVAQPLFLKISLIFRS